MNPELQRLLDQMDPQLRAAFLEAVARIRSETQIRLLVAALEAKDIRAAAAVLQMDASLFALLDKAVLDAFWAGGVSALAKAPRVVNPFLDRPSPSGLTGGTSGQSNGRGPGRGR